MMNALLAVAASGLAPTLSGLPPVVKAGLSTLRWHADFTLQGRRACRLGTDVEVRDNNMGQGLYAKRTLEVGTLVGRYTGVLLNGETFDNSESKGDYAMELANGDVIDGQNPSRSSFVRYINHSVRKTNCETCEAWEEDSPLGAVYVETTKRIEAGEELRMDYGPYYWDELLKPMPRFLCPPEWWHG